MEIYNTFQKEKDADAQAGVRFYCSHATVRFSCFYAHLSFTYDEMEATNVCWSQICNCKKDSDWLKRWLNRLVDAQHTI